MFCLFICNVFDVLLPGSGVKLLLRSLLRFGVQCKGLKSSPVWPAQVQHSITALLLKPPAGAQWIHSISLFSFGLLVFNDFMTDLAIQAAKTCFIRRLPRIQFITLAIYYQFLLHLCDPVLWLFNRGLMILHLLHSLMRLFFVLVCILNIEASMAVMTGASLSLAWPLVALTKMPGAES